MVASAISAIDDGLDVKAQGLSEKKRVSRLPALCLIGTISVSRLIDGPVPRRQMSLGLKNDLDKALPGDQCLHRIMN